MFGQALHFFLYVGHLPMACHFWGMDSSGANASISSDTKGLPSRPTKTQRFQNSLTPSIVAHLVKRQTWDSEISRLFYVAYLFTTRLLHGACIYIALFRVIYFD